MSDLRQCSREFLCEFIALYKSYPCLWCVKSKEYRDRAKKDEAYSALVLMYKQIDEAASKETVKKKINSLRTVYRKELAKLNKSIRSGAKYEDLYKPSLWYYDLFGFLSDQEFPQTNAMDEECAEITEEAGNEADESDDAVAVETHSAPATPVSHTSPIPTHERRFIPCRMCRSQSSSRKRKLPTDDQNTYEVMENVGKKLQSIQKEDTYDVFGKHIANKLRAVSRQQNVFAQKLISDVVFEAELETLTRSFRVVDFDEAQRQFGQTRDKGEWQP